jgi:hypothetical protein
MKAPSIGGIAAKVAVYGAIAFAFSLLGFVALPPAFHFHEYSFPDAVLEIGGHFAFGFVAALPLWDLEPSLVCGGFALLIDSDHLLATLNLSYASRPDHSIAFAMVATAGVWLLARKSKTLQIGGSAARASLLVLVSILSHISYDVLAGYTIFQGRGFSFPILSPFNYTLFAFPFWSWVPLEVAAVALCYFGATAISLLRSTGGTQSAGGPAHDSRVGSRVTSPLAL